MDSALKKILESDISDVSKVISTLESRWEIDYMTKTAEFKCTDYSQYSIKYMIIDLISLTKLEINDIYYPTPSPFSAIYNKISDYRDKKEAELPSTVETHTLWN
tara:strand:+ start:7996 stop:8307 length:312 start_codon:yes stop_codon:yes gene_type:complete